MFNLSIVALTTILLFSLNSDDDEFYDRTQKPAKRKGGENQSIETADSLLDKKDAIVKEMEDKRQLLLSEDKTGQVNENLEAADELDVFMSGLSSQLGLYYFGFVILVINCAD